jgi:hypothetical protein
LDEKDIRRPGKTKIAVVKLAVSRNDILIIKRLLTPMVSFRRSLLRPVARMVMCLTIAALIGQSRIAEAKNPAAEQTIVFLRHGEKPEAGLGQLSCKGLNRSLALPAVLAGKFGTPDAIFAPDPTKKKDDGGRLYDYVRPLATIEPTAIAAGLPVDTSYGYEDIDQLKAALSAPKYSGSKIFVAWEHKQIHALVGELLKDNGGDPAAMPKKWKGEDFDSLYIVRIDRSQATPKSTFELKTEGLDAVSASCLSR